MAAANMGGSVEVPLALLINQCFEKCISIIYTSSMACQLLSHREIYSFLFMVIEFPFSLHTA